MSMKWIVLIVMVLMYVLIVLFPEKKCFCSLGAALLMILIGAVSPGDAVKQVHWNVLMIFAGSHIIAELFIYSRTPAVIAGAIVSNSPNAGIAITVILIITGFLSALVENVAVLLVMTPVILSLCLKLKADPSYFIAGLAVIANLQGTATMVGDPPSMIFAEHKDYNFNDFFVYNGRPSIFFAVQIGVAAGMFFFYHFFAKKHRDRVSIKQEKIRSPVPGVLLFLMIAGLILISCIEEDLSLNSGFLVLGLGMAGLAWFKWIRRESNEEIRSLVKNLDWDTSFFLIGIFVVVGAASLVKLPEIFALILARLVGKHIFLGFLFIIGFSVLISGFVDNVPYIIAMLPVTANLAADLAIRPELYTFALLIGSCLGGNLTPFGTSANVVSLGILRKQGIKMNCGRWFRLGLPFTFLTTSAAAAFIWLIWK
jgi:Na+/H+ antiporter NhaD/arsenite permease-like protein